MITLETAAFCVLGGFIGGFCIACYLDYINCRK